MASHRRSTTRRQPLYPTSRCGLIHISGPLRSTPPRPGDAVRTRRRAVLPAVHELSSPPLRAAVWAVRAVESPRRGGGGAAGAVAVPWRQLLLRGLAQQHSLRPRCVPSETASGKPSLSPFHPRRSLPLRLLACEVNATCGAYAAVAFQVREGGGKEKESGEAPTPPPSAPLRRPRNLAVPWLLFSH